MIQIAFGAHARMLHLFELSAVGVDGLTFSSILSYRENFVRKALEKSSTDWGQSLATHVSV
jgi:hypothetical protein